MKPRRFAMVIGMGRSGTSLACQAIARLGHEFGKTLGPSPGNKIGYYEHIELSNLQRSMTLRFFGIGDWVFHGELENRWGDPNIDPYVEKAVEIITKYNLEVFKDPLSTRCLPFWNRVFVLLKISPVYINCIRERQQVFSSLLVEGEAIKKPSNATKHKVMKIWADFVVAAERIEPEVELWYEDWFDDPWKNMNKLYGALGGNEPTIEGLVIRELRHDATEISL